MAIGTSKGAFHEDEFRHEASPWFIDPKLEDTDNNIIDPDLDTGPKQLANPIINVALIEDRTNQSSKEVDNNMVDDQQLPLPDYSMSKDIFGKFYKDSGAFDLDNMERDKLVEIIRRGMSLKAGNDIPVYDSKGKLKK